MEAEHDAQPLILDEPADQRIDTAIAAQPYQVGRNPDHIANGPERGIAQFLEPDAARRLAQPHEALIAGDIAGRQPRHLGPHRVGIAGAVEAGPIGEPDPIERRHRLQRHVIRHGPTAQPPQFLQQERRGQDRRAGVEGEPVLAEHRRPPTGCIQLLQHGDPVTPSAQPDRRRQAAETRPDHHRMARIGRVASRWQVDDGNLSTNPYTDCKHNMTALTIAQ